MFEQWYIIDTRGSDKMNKLKPPWWKRLGSTVVSAYKKPKDKISPTYEEAKEKGHQIVGKYW
jgi:hypothetical protein